ncbi:MAG: amidohydrolase family protein, partial [Pseudomonadota bacterium]|nr:amidohydrolase family protein [Pseudomonadota bacterium]
PLTGRKVIDARGLIVAPGFIELHQHGFDPRSFSLLALDGVTTALELEVGVTDVERFRQALEGKALIHFGASASLLVARMKAWDLPVPPSRFGDAAAVIPKSGPATNDPATPEQLARLLARLRSEVEAGALGIGIGLEYAPGTTRHELIEVFRLAKALEVPVFVHARSSGLIEPGSGVEAVTELIGAAAITGAALHVVHVNSVCMRDAMKCIAMMAGARERGLDVTTEAYPYTVAMTAINSAYFNPGWRERRGIEYDAIEIPETGERLTRERFDELHAETESRPVLIHLNPDRVVDDVMTEPSVIVASDGLPEHPRGAGTRARVLARYVREQKSLGLVDAIRKMTLMPAQRLERSTPDAKRLGRIQEHARADIVVFDDAMVEDRATFRSPTDASIGMRYVLVAGTLVVEAGEVVGNVAPGRALIRGGDESAGD